MKDNEWRQLVHSALNNDKAAFERLYKETERSVYFLCLKLLGNEQDAKDIVQETYLAAYNGLSALDDGANFPKWVNGIAVNQCRKLFRAPDNESFDEKLEQGKEFADEENFIPEEYVADAEKRKVIMNMIDTELSEVQRQTVILYYYNGLKTHEIAGIMNCPDGTVKYRLSAAREKIREAVLIYEEEHKERLHAVMPIPVLTRILRSEAERIAVPDIRLFEDPAASANNYKAGGNASMKSALTGKIITAVAAVVVVCGGIAAGVAISNRDPGRIGADSSNATADTGTETNHEIGSAGSASPGSDESSEISENTEIPVDPSNESEAPEETEAVMTEEEWFMTTKLHDGISYLKGVLETNAYFLSRANFADTYSMDYRRENFSNNTELILPEVELEIDLSKCVYEGKAYDDDDGLVLDNDEHKGDFYSFREKCVLTKPHFYNIDNDLVFSFGNCWVAYAYSHGIYEVKRIHFYNAAGSEVGVYEFPEANCSNCLSIYEDFSDDIVSYSIDFNKHFENSIYDDDGNRYYAQLNETDEDFYKDYNIITDHDLKELSNDFDFGYDDDAGEDESRNPYKDAGLDMRWRYFILRQCPTTAGFYSVDYHNKTYRNMHISVVGFTYDEENNTLTDKVVRRFSLDTETGYTALLLDENKVWFYLND